MKIQNIVTNISDNLKHLALALPLGAAVFFGTGQVDGQNIEYTGTAGGAWSDPANWQYGVVPTGVDQPIIDSVGPTIGASDTVSLTGGFYIGNGGMGSVLQTGGSVTVANMEPGYATQGTYTLSGGTLNLTQGGWDLLLGRNGNGTFNLEGGTLNSASQIWMGWSGGTGVFNMTNGTLNSSYAGVAFQFTQGQVNFGGGDMYLTGDQTAIGNNAWFQKTGVGTYAATYDGTNTHLYYKPPTSSDKDIVSFTFPTYGAATISGTNISLTVPLGTDVTALAPIYTVSVGATCVPASGSTNNFSNPVHYVVTAADSSIKQYTVTVTIVPVMLTFGPGATITGTNIVWTGPLGIVVTNLAPIYTVSQGASGSPASGTPLDFTTPQAYTVTAAGYPTQVYTVTLNLVQENINYIGAADGAWNQPTNWAGGFVPLGPNQPIVGLAGYDGVGPVIGDTDTVVLTKCLYIGSSATGYVRQTGGSLTAGSLEPGYQTPGTYTLSGGTLTLQDPGWDLLIGRFGNGTFNLEGGTLNSAGLISLSWPGFSGTGVFNMTGGTLNSTYSGTAFQFANGAVNFGGGDIYLTGDQTTITNNEWFYLTGTGPCTVSFDGTTTHLYYVTPLLEQPTLSANGFSFSFSGPSGQPYTLLSTTNVALPLSQWQTNSTGLLTGPNSPIGFTNATPHAVPHMFYRVRSP